MLTTMSKLFVRTLREEPAEAELASHKLLIRAGYIRRVAPGVYSWLPLGLMTLRKIEDVIRQEMAAAGAQEVLFPALLPKEPYEASGRWEEYGANLFRLQDRRGSDYLLAPTHEEMFTLMVKDMVNSYKELPLTLYQIQTKYRDEARSRGGLLRGREFLMKDAYSFDLDDAQLQESYDAQRDAYQRIFDRLGLTYVICSAVSGAMGGSASEEFLVPSNAGEDVYVVSPGGYVANTEAVVTVAPQPTSWEGLPEAKTLPTPNSETIEALVEQANALFPREDRPWEAGDTLKNVVCAVTDGEGQRSLLVVGVPGDREVDMKRLEASLEPLEVEVATDEDFEAYPQLVQGYIGPDILGLGEDGEGIRYLVDPRVAPGTSWVSGANQDQAHTFGLVMGRDFGADGTIEAAEVKEGDQAPDGSGPLTLHRGIEVGHIFQLGRKYAEVLGLRVLDENGKSRVVTMGSYGIGVSRVLAALAEENYDDSGLVWPAAVAPFDVDVVVAGKGEELEAAARELAEDLESTGLDVLLDDRRGVSAGVKFADSELIGFPITVVVGRGLKNGKVEVRVRRSGERAEVPFELAVIEITRLHQRLMEAVGESTDALLLGKLDADGVA